MHSQPGRVSRRDVVIAMTLFVCSIAFAIRHSQQVDLHGDELWTRMIVRLPLSDTWPFLVRDGKHPPFYAALQYSLGSLLPDTPFGLRMVSILACGLIPTSAHLLARRLGVAFLPALTCACWLAVHSSLRRFAIEARAYELLALLVLVHAGLVASAIQQRRSSRRVAVVAVLCVLTHAFGILFVSANCLAVFLAMRTSTKVRRSEARRRLISMHAPAVIACIAWYAFIMLSLRQTSGITAGLEWMPPATLSDRLVSFAQVLGSASYRHGTALTLWLWLAIIAGCLAGTRSAPRTALAVGLVFVSLLLPVAAQQIASGLVVDLPLFGTKHVMASAGPLALAVAFSGSIVSMDRRAVGFSLSAIVALTLLSLSTRPEVPSHTLSLAARQFQLVNDSAEVRSVDAYNDLSTFNYYLDRDCLDDLQMKVQFPDVKGLPDFGSRSRHCVAKQADVPVDAKTVLLFMSWRPFVPSESAYRDSLLHAGQWHVQRQIRTSTNATVVDVLRRR